MTKRMATEVRDVIAWVEKRPGVSGIVRGSHANVRHGRGVGSVEVVSEDAAAVRLRVFDEDGAIDVFVYANDSNERTTWIALIAVGAVGKGSE